MSILMVMLHNKNVNVISWSHLSGKGFRPILFHVFSLQLMSVSKGINDGASESFLTINGACIGAAHHFCFAILSTVALACRFLH